MPRIIMTRFANTFFSPCFFAAVFEPAGPAAPPVTDSYARGGYDSTPRTHAVATGREDKPEVLQGVLGWVAFLRGTAAQAYAGCRVTQKAQHRPRLTK